MSWIRHKKPSRVMPVRGRLGRWRECLSIQAHLAYCELKLRLRTRPDEITRLQLLDHLHQYWRAGRFPENKFHASGRQPIFIDEEGTYCAVGYLMAQSGAQGLAAAINRDNRFVYIEDLDLSEHPEIRSWLSKHELSQTEAALIQPGYAAPSYDYDKYVDLNGFFYPVVIGVLVFWLILNLGALMMTIDLIRTTRQLRDDIDPIRKTRQHEEDLKLIREEDTRPEEDTESEDIKSIETAHRTWSNNFFLFQRRLGYSALILFLNLALITCLAFVGTLTLIYIDSHIGTFVELRNDNTLSTLEEVGMIILYFGLIPSMGSLLLAINLIRKTRELQHGVNPIATTRPIRWMSAIKAGLTAAIRGGVNPIATTHRREEDTKPIEVSQIWSDHFSFFRKRLGYSALIVSSNLAFVLVGLSSWRIIWVLITYY